jgi:hypothetical protein
LIFTIDGYNRSSSKEQGSCGRIPYGKEVSAWTMRTNGNMIIPLRIKTKAEIPVIPMWAAAA